ncbi:MAG: radical SAM protein [Deltaproteobacteria bacterium]|nr:radical SAM protein [Deltaproteobacteria bacterium]MBW2047493.1 radical SAM protein [Deltaproteobacteria bacterium]MBW2111719.1 radical SAM protein [Deltaproteobacteria bacterium]MBW2352084.1 radical SAM protein [Deltaproteobacteria bacterium]
MQGLDERLARAREISWQRFGKEITFYLPGMFSYNGLSGKYPAISITGNRCALQCDHCQSKTLEPMIHAETPETLTGKCLDLAEKGNLGVLISGGCDRDGRLPWNGFIRAISEIRRQTALYISIHCGLVDLQTALELRDAGVDQALIDVIGDDETYQRVYHVDFGVSRIESSLEALKRASLPVIPHIVCGLNHGRMVGEERAVEMIAPFEVRQMVVVSLMRIPGTPSWKAERLKAEEVARLIAEARFRLPHTEISLGCARERGNTSMETLAVQAGVNRMALPSDEAIELAVHYGLKIRYQRTCCSVRRDFSGDKW